MSTEARAAGNPASEVLEVVRNADGRFYELLADGQYVPGSWPRHGER